jgi:DNA-directed RNA polymerase subunit beta
LVVNDIPNQERLTRTFERSVNKMTEYTNPQSLSCQYANSTYNPLNPPLLRGTKGARGLFSDGRVGRLSIDGLPKGAGAPIGNALRRTLLSQLEGVAVTAVRIAGARHEFDCVDGVTEDITEIIANLRQLELKVCDNKNETLLLRICTNQREVKALDIETNGDVEILNPQLHIATLNPGARLKMEIEVEKGTGFRLARDNRKHSHSFNTIPVTSDFSPVKRVGYTVDGNDGQSNELHLEIVTNGTITPVDAASRAVEILMGHLEDGVTHSEFNGKTGQFGLKEPAVQLLGSALRWELLSYKTESNDRPVLDVQVQPSNSAVEIRTDGTLSPKATFDDARKQLSERFARIHTTIANTSITPFESPLPTQSPPTRILANSATHLKSCDFSHSPIVFGDTAFAENAPDLLVIQRDSYNWFLNKGLPECLAEMFPIKSSDGSNTLELLGHHLKHDSQSQGKTYAAPLFLNLRLSVKKEEEIVDVKESQVYACQLPLMTEKGTFIINGVERVIVSQLIRSPGAIFSSRNCAIIPYRGAWMEFEIESDGSIPNFSFKKKSLIKRNTEELNKFISARIDRREKMPATILLRALGWNTNDEILGLFSDAELIRKTLENDNTANQKEALIEISKKLQPDVDATLEDAKERFVNMFFNIHRYDFSRVGRYMLNKKLDMQVSEDERILKKEDVVEALKYFLKVHIGEKPVDDPEHLANRRVRCVGESLQNQFRIGLSQIARAAKERMDINDLKDAMPQDVFNSKPLEEAITDFFSNSQLSQFAQQTNPLDELTHSRRLSGANPPPTPSGGGEKREFSHSEVPIEARDVHHTHYGRICPIETPEGPNVGLILSLSTHAKVNEYGFLEAPFRKGEAADEIEYLTADKSAKTEFSHSEFQPAYPQQILGVSASLIPLIEHDDPGRALMGANMQRQAVPLIFTEPPLVQTGMERKVALDSHAVVCAKRSGRVTKATADEIVILFNNGDSESYKLIKHRGSNAGMDVNQKPIVSAGQTVQAGQVITDGQSVKDGLLSLGRNVLVAYMPWEGYNYEDAIVISDRLVKDDVFTSVQIETFRVEARETKEGVECLSRNIPNIPETELEELDEHGIVKVGTWVKSPDILVGRKSEGGSRKAEVTTPWPPSPLPKGGRGVVVRGNNSEFRIPPYIEGQVIRTEYLSREQGDDLPPGVEEVAIVEVAMKRELKVGDKLANRHGNKGVVAKIVSVEDMPHLPDGTPVDMILNPLGVPTRMNLGQILETHLGWAASKLGRPIISPPYNGASNEDIEKLLQEAGLPKNGMLSVAKSRASRTTLYDGRTGRTFDMKITVGYQYQMKLAQMVDDKMHARSIGPYSVVTGQPLGGRSQMGGQRFGEMEVWALEAYGAAHTLYEMLTVKSNAKVGLDLYKKIAMGEEIHSMDFERRPVPRIGTRSFEVLSLELRGLGIDWTQDEQGIHIHFASSDEIRQWSEGEVKLEERKGLPSCPLALLPSCPSPNAMGHIELATPVCHTWLVKPAFKPWIRLREQALGLNPKEFEKVVYCKGHIITDPGDTNLQLKQLFDNGSYKAKREELGDRFKSLTGGEAIRWLWKQVDMDTLMNYDDAEVVSLAREMRDAGIRPEVMVMDVIPVVPASIRPTLSVSQKYDVESEIGETVTSDLNALYQEVIFRNDRVRKLIELQAPETVICNEKRMLQEAVDNLFDNGPVNGTDRHGRTACDSKNRPLVSLSDMLKGKSGLFRQSLLGARVDYSGRSVIVPGPELKLNECGLPRRMALTLFEPYVIRNLLTEGHGQSISAAKRLVSLHRPEALVALNKVASDKLVMLNRAPTLHRAGIQAFKPMLIDDNAIRLHPLVCPAFNADFDGDMMAVHVPIAEEVQQEVRDRMLSHRNLLSPRSGRLLAKPTMDILLGCYYLTMNGKRARGQEGKRVEFSIVEAKRAYELSEVGLHDKIQLKLDNETIETTVGRAIFNEILDGKLPYVNETSGKDRIYEIVETVYREHGEDEAVNLLNRIDDLGFYFATRMGASISLETLKTDVNLVEYATGECENSIFARMQTELLESFAQSMNGMNPLHLMQISGARASLRNAHRIAGLTGPVVTAYHKTKSLVSEANTNEGKPVHFKFIKGNYRDGLSPSEYFTLAYVARRGLADTAEKVELSGYLMRKLADVASDVVVTEEDCGTKKERNVVNCETVYGVCAKCYGMDLSTGQPVKLGEPVGIIAANAIGEPMTQLITLSYQTREGRMITAISKLDELFEVQKSQKKVDKGTIEVDGVDYKLPKLLEKEGVECVHPILLKAMMNIYQENDIEIEPKHFEVIIRQMLKQVEITDAGSTNLYAGQKVTRLRLAEENAQATAKNGRPAEYKPLICGVTEIALANDSFLSAAAFQQTTNVLTQAALRGATDPLRGMRECVIAGKLIPAGTGFE